MILQEDIKNVGGLQIPCFETPLKFNVIVISVDTTFPSKMRVTRGPPIPVRD